MANRKTPEDELLDRLLESVNAEEGEDVKKSEKLPGTDVAVDELLALLRDEHGVALSGKRAVKQPTEEQDAIDDFEFDDRPIEADYLNYNMIGRNLDSASDGASAFGSEVNGKDANAFEETKTNERAKNTEEIEETEEAEEVEEAEKAEEIEEAEEAEEAEEIEEIEQVEDPLYEAIRTRYMAERGLSASEVEKVTCDFADEVPDAQAESAPNTEDASDEDDGGELVLDWSAIYGSDDAEPEVPEESEELEESNGLEEPEAADALSEAGSDESLLYNKEEKVSAEENETSLASPENDEKTARDMGQSQDNEADRLTTEAGNTETASEEEQADLADLDDEILDALNQLVSCSEDNGSALLFEEHSLAEEEKPNEELPVENEPEAMLSEEEALFDASDEDTSEEPQETDAEDLSAAFGMKSRDSHVKPKARGKGSSTPVEDSTAERAHGKRIVLPSRRYNKEFTAYSQADYIKNGYKAALHTELIRLALLMGLTFLAFCLESLHLLGLTFLMPSENPIPSIVVSTVIILLACFLTLREYTDGSIMLFRGKPVPESILFPSLMAPLVYYIIALAEGSAPDTVFGFAFCIAALVCKLQTVFRLLREAKTFAVVSAQKPKRVLSRMTSAQSAKEAEVFGSYVGLDTPYFCVKRTLFVDDYFRETNTVAKSKRSVAVFLLLSLLVALLLFVLAYTDGYGVAGSLSYAVISLFYTMPFSCLLLFEAPLLWASFSAADGKAAILGESAIESYAGEGVVSLSDSDIFPPSDISLVNILLFGERYVEKMMNYTALLFDEINSSVSTVLLRSVPHYRLDDAIRIVNVYDDGIEAMINEEQVLVGGYAFMRAWGAAFPKNYTYRPNSCAQMFTAVNGEVLGKLDLDYRLDPDAAEALRYLAEGGHCVAIRTLDPNITPEFLESKLDCAEYPIVLMKAGDDRELLRMRKHLTCSVVSCSNTKSLMNALVLCGKSDFARKIGLLFAAVSFLAGAALMVLSLKLSTSAFISGRGIALFQVFWLLPVILTSSLYVRGRRRKTEKTKPENRKSAKAERVKSNKAKRK